MRCAHLALLTACVLWPARGQAEDAAAPLPAPALPIAEIVRRTIEVMDASRLAVARGANR